MLQFDIDTCQTFYHHQKPLSVEQGVKEEAWDPSIFQNIENKCVFNKCTRFAIDDCS